MAGVLVVAGWGSPRAHLPRVIFRSAPDAAARDAIPAGKVAGGTARDVVFSLVSSYAAIVAGSSGSRSSSRQASMARTRCGETALSYPGGVPVIQSPAVLQL